MDRTFDRVQPIDFHNHLIPGVDDGAQDIEQARTGVQALTSQGIREFIVTPHVAGALVENHAHLIARLTEIDAGWERLRELIDAEFPDVTIHRGAEVKLDTPQPDVSDRRLRLAETKFTLVEFPYLTIPPASERALSHLASNGWIPVVAHPERYKGVEKAFQTVAEWRRAGAYLQVNAGSVLGRYGESAQKAALELLERGWVSYLCSDFHSRGEPHVRRAIQALTDRGGEEQARLLLETNPRRLLNGELPIPASPLAPPRGLFRRLLGALGG